MLAAGSTRSLPGCITHTVLEGEVTPFIQYDIGNCCHFSAFISHKAKTFKFTLAQLL